MALLLAAVIVTACTESAIPTSTLAAPEPSEVSTSVERQTAPATLAWQARGRGIAIRSLSSPLNSAHLYGVLGIAQYAAAVAADDALGIVGAGDASVIGADEGGRAQYEMRRGAIGAASNVVLVYLAGLAFNSAPPLTRALLAPEIASMAAQLAKEGIGPNGRTHPQFTRGVELGNTIGADIVKRAETDGFTTPWDNKPYLASSGKWYQPNPLVAPAGYQFAAMRPYFLADSAQFHSVAPPAYSSDEFKAALKVVVDISNVRSPAQADSARNWNLNVGTYTTLGYWGVQAESFIVERGLGDRAAAHVYALTNAAAVDAAIGCWETKYTELVLRPYHLSSAITLPIGQPPHPSYPSGHSCVSSAAATVLAAFFPDKSRQLQTDVALAGRSRVLGGIHYEFDVSAGQDLGRNVGAWALKYDREEGLLTTLTRSFP